MLMHSDRFYLCVCVLLSKKPCCPAHHSLSSKLQLATPAEHASEKDILHHQQNNKQTTLYLFILDLGLVRSSLNSYSCYYATEPRSYRSRIPLSCRTYYCSITLYYLTRQRVSSILYFYFISLS
ncbi:hypothetical protein BCR41DRAFT_236418 [Lobosporangium transversale]|uniref:Uncharacterized protein n=1 Tax=Lobosporangium transversale TaxID=64571 RepID=A0A1Y2GWE7_9FUNG|nr:hypothetical protein BCR41DRAFT_236418 [Lobosporangium transversale]ORZ24918.1 hypothetical protein BCR41DRAFT_236418 [Lobosporangium transversale]|eukprot:XP_021883899.1 hypothetical protein BCR41DRAFT_236418 [Lobosporangium transversale]